MKLSTIMQCFNFKKWRVLISRGFSSNEETGVRVPITTDKGNVWAV